MSDTERTTGVGRVSQVIGSIVDVEFPPDHLPEMYNALETMIQVDEDTPAHKLTLEVAQFLGDDVVRCLALKPTDGLVRGQEVTDTGAPISVPVGDVTKGHVLNVTGEGLNLKEGETLEVKERWPINRDPHMLKRWNPKHRCLKLG